MPIVYVLTNEAMPGLVKIGRSDFPIEQRMKQLDTTGLPLPFECFLAAEVADPGAVEKALHVAFGDQRIRATREFFRISPDKPAAILRLLVVNNVTPAGDVVDVASDQAALDKARSRKTNFKFEAANVPVGAVLQSVFDPDIVATVISSKKVLFRGDEHSCSSSALIVAHEKGYTWPTINGPAYWKFEDETLSSRRDGTADDGGDE